MGLISMKLAPALLAGCTVVLKTSPEAPGEGYVISEAAEAVGLPPGVLNVVTGADEVVVGEATPVLGDIGDVVGLELFDELHAAMDSAATPVTANIANRASGGVRERADINVSPIVVVPTNGCTRWSCAESVY